MQGEMKIQNRMHVSDQLKRTSKLFPEKEAIVDLSRDSNPIRNTYQEWDEKSNQVAQALIDTGMEKGDVLAIVGHNSVDWLHVFFGAPRAGIVVSPLNPAIHQDTLNYEIDHCEADYIITDAAFLEKAKIAAEENEAEILAVIPVGGDVDDFPTVQEFIDGYPALPPEVLTGDRDILEILYTSGTTSAPKGVLTSHIGAMSSMMNGALEFGYDENTRFACILPLFHCGQQAHTLAGLVFGMTNVIKREFDPTDFLEEMVEKEGVTAAFLHASQARALAEMDVSDHDTSPLRRVWYAMAPLEQNTISSLNEKWGCKSGLYTGQTETFPPSSLNHPEDEFKLDLNVWGTPCPLQEHAIMDSEGNILDDGESGEICIRGPTVMEGYLKDQEKTKQASLYNWHHMGDLGYFDPEHDLLVFDDRKKDMIKTGGENVPSVRVEGTLDEYPDVDRSAVVGLPHDRWGEAITAFVVGNDVDEDGLIKYCEQNLSRHEVPKRVIEVKDLPHTATNKIQKAELREEYANLYRSEAG
ncbi:class I adenylate-forming enzyme family protein [Haladaptatus sp. NG-SE-30]